MPGVTIQRAKEVASLYDGSNIREIAEQLGIKENSVERYLRAAKVGQKRISKGVRAPKILLVDIETAPSLVLVWGLRHNDYIPHDHVVDEGFIISWAAKWLNDSKMMSDVVTSEEALACNDKRIIKGIWELVNEAHIVVGQNVQRFDCRWVNARFIVHGMGPPLPYQIIDTLKVTQREFKFLSHKLDYLNKILGLPRKRKTDWEWWRKIKLEGDEKYLQKMVSYNRRDVSALEELYLEIRPWVKSHPNIGLYVTTDVPVCPACGSENLTWQGYYYTPMNKYKAFRCGCGAIGRARSSDVSPKEKNRLTRSTAR